MTHILPRQRGRGQHRAPSVAELRSDNDRLTCELTQAVIRGSADALALADARKRIAELEAKVRLEQGRVARAKAEQERLRAAVINARPRITYTAQPLDRPYVPEYVQIPYPVPVGRDTSGDDTQQLPIVDLPGRGAA